MAEPWSAVPEWIHKADADWRAVEALIGDQSNSLHDVVVFHAQQSVEKLLKARLIQLGQDLRKIHDLAALSIQLQSVDQTWQWDLDELGDLSTGAVLSRYPGFDISAEEAAELVELAQRIRESLLLCLAVRLDEANP